MEVLKYCKSGNIRGTFAYFAQIQQARIQKPAKILASTKMTSEHLLSANLTTREYVFVLPNAKI